MQYSRFWAIKFTLLPLCIGLHYAVLKILSYEIQTFAMHRTSLCNFHNLLRNHTFATLHRTSLCCFQDMYWAMKFRLLPIAMHRTSLCNFHNLLWNHIFATLHRTSLCYFQDTELWNADFCWVRCIGLHYAIFIIINLLWNHTFAT